MSGEQRITIEVLMPQLPGDPPGARRIEEARTPERFAQLVELAWRAAELQAAEARELMEVRALGEWSDSCRHVHYWWSDPTDCLTAESRALIAAGLAASPYAPPLAPWPWRMPERSHAQLVELPTGPWPWSQSVLVHPRVAAAVRAVTV